MNFRQDIEGRYTRRCAEVEENGGVETPVQFSRSIMSDSL